MAEAAVPAAAYLGPQHAGVEFALDPANPLPYARPSGEVYKEEQKGEFDFIHKMDEHCAVAISGRPGADCPHQIVRTCL